MKHRLTIYLKEIDRILAEEEQERDYEELAREHLVQIGFFMHDVDFWIIGVCDFFCASISIFSWTARAICGTARFAHSLYCTLLFARKRSAENVSAV